MDAIRQDNFPNSDYMGHPLALQIACYYAWESPEDLLKVELQTKQEIEEYFLYSWQSLSLAEKELLCNTIDASLLEAKNPALHILLRNLTRKCLLIKKNGSYEFSSKAWADFVSIQ